MQGMLQVRQLSLKNAGSLTMSESLEEAVAILDMSLTYPLPVCWLCEEPVDPVEKVECSVCPVHMGLYVRPFGHHEAKPTVHS